jgi:predicted Fe-Mo cluster-binding NifX family protein
MKIAVPVIDDSRINGHFGKSASFDIFSVTDDRIASVKRISSYQGTGCKSGIAGDLANEGVTVVLASGIGNGALNKLNKAGLSVITGCQGSPKDNVELFISGKLTDQGSTCDKHAHGKDDHEHGKSHHEHGHNHPISGADLKIR